MMASPSSGANAHVHSRTSSLSSFSMLTSTLSSDEPFEEGFDELTSSSSSDEDEIVWTGSNEFDPDEDFILVPQSRPIPLGSTLSHRHDEPPHVALEQLSLTDSAPATPTFPKHAGDSKAKPKPLGYNRARRSAGAPALASTAQAPVSTPRTHRGRRRRGKRDAAASYPSPSPSPIRESAAVAEDHVSVLERPSNGPDKPKQGLGGFGAQPLVEDDDEESEPVIQGYEDAVRYITDFLSNPSTALSCSSCTRLTFLQSLIIELGLLSPNSLPPPSLKAAKRLLKARAFINIGEYLHAREQGIDKLREVMFSSKRELTSDLRKKKGGRKADKGWVKRHGLNVLLVSVF